MLTTLPPGMRPQKVYSSKNWEQGFYPGIGPRKYAPLGMGSRDSTLRNKAPETMLPQEWEVGIIPLKMGPRKYTPKKWGVTAEDDKSHGSRRPLT